MKRACMFTNLELDDNNNETDKLLDPAADDITHGICTVCFKKHFPEEYKAWGLN